MIEIARRGAMAADHVVGEDFKLGLGIEFGGLRQQQRMARLLAVGLLGIALHDDLALEDTAGIVVHHAFEKFAAGAVGHLVIDDEAAVGVLLAAQQIGAGDLRIRPLPGEVIGAVLPVDTGARGQGEIAQHDTGSQSHMGMGKMDRRLGLALHLDAVEPRSISEPDFGDAVGKIGAFAQMGFDQCRGGSRRHLDHIAGGDGAGLGVGGDEDKLDRQVDAARQHQPGATSGERLVEPQHRFVGGNPRGSIAIRQPGAPGVIFAVDEHHARRRHLNERRRLDQAVDIGGFGLHRQARRIGPVDQCTEVRPLPILHAGIGQQLAAIGEFGGCSGDGEVHATSLANSV